MKNYIKAFINGASKAYSLGTPFSKIEFSNGNSQTDAEKLREDWIAVGNDLRSAMQKFDK
ncbi:hypothetical protein ACQW5G_03325 [Fructilactobacillus sp. Tb1]|uniref:hypothetical protein n=1 Tax=Fructilactobacillus sp. Tb1 TaxID=3422304 RepID=UPI003D2657A5